MKKSAFFRMSLLPANSPSAQGPQVRGFEKELGTFHGLPPGIATSSGTTALHLALLSLGVGQGDEVLLPSYVCSAPLHAVYHSGATPVLVDVDPKTGNIDPDDLKRRLTPRSKVIVVVHLFGLPASLSDIVGLGLPVIEDCAQALGAELEREKIGTLGKVAICSFYATKIITTGEGGMLLSPDLSLLARAKDLRDYDKKEHFSVRFNYKMTDLQAALGRSQLQKLESFLGQREALAEVYNKELATLPCTLPPSPEGRIFYRYVISIQENVRELVQKLLNMGIEVARPVYRPLHRYLNLEDYPGAEMAWQSHLSLPIHPSLTSEDVHRVCHTLQQALTENPQ
ncbi:MAG: DegT/DnrJ/EryC1/StrS family aminotransferase [Deltaproteobacteria bacterium]